MNIQIVLFASLLLSGVTILYGVVFSFQIAGNPLIGVLVAVMMLGFNILEFSMVFFVTRFIAERLLMPIVVGVFIIIAGVLFSVFSNIWVVSGAYDSYIQNRRVVADEYKAWLGEKEFLSKKINALRELNIVESEEKRALADARHALDAILTAPAFNSNNARTGSTVGLLTENCSRVNFYYKRYCGDYTKLESIIQSANDKLLKSQALSALSASMVELSKSPPVSGAVHAPGVTSVSLLTGIDSENVIAFMNFLFSIFNEIGAIFGWFVVGYSSKKKPPAWPVELNDILTGPAVEALTQSPMGRALRTKSENSVEALTQSLTVPALKTESENSAEALTQSPTGRALKTKSDKPVSDDESRTRERLGEKMRTLVQSSGLTNSEFAGLINVPASTFAEYSSGRRIMPLNVLLKMKASLKGFDIDDFLTN